jgi:hypothetical protein
LSRSALLVSIEAVLIANVTDEARASGSAWITEKSAKRPCTLEAK